MSFPAAKPNKIKSINSDGDIVNLAIVENQLSQMMTRVASDSVDSNIVYTGTAKIDSLSSEAVWKITRYDDSVDEIAKFVDNGNYSQIWDNRESLTYN